jgi:hypothetical protein
VIRTQTEQARLATLTPAQYAAESNAATRAWLEANPDGWATFLDETEGAYSEYANALELVFEFACAEFSDFYKGVHGIRPRWARFDSLEAVEAALEALSVEAAEEAQWEAERAAAREKEAAEATEAARLEATRTHEERFLDTAASLGFQGW